MLLSQSEYTRMAHAAQLQGSFMVKNMILSCHLCVLSKRKGSVCNPCIALTLTPLSLPFRIAG